MNQNLISLNNVKYRLGNNTSFSLNINKFILDKSDSILIYGESGAGKSTFLNLLTILANCLLSLETTILLKNFDFVAIFIVQ